MKIIYSIDGGTNWLTAPEGVRVTVEQSDDFDIAINVTHEGMIVDAWNKDGSLHGTDSEDFSQIVDRLK